jgi:hypothetical protein
MGCWLFGPAMAKTMDAPATPKGHLPEGNKEWGPGYSRFRFRLVVEAENRFSREPKNGSRYLILHITLAVFIDLMIKV